MHGLVIPGSVTVALHEHNTLTKGKTEMRTIMRNSIYLPMAAVLLTAALAGPAAADDKLVPFSGSLHAKESIVSFQGAPPVSFVVDGTGGGRATPPWLFFLAFAV